MRRQGPKTIDEAKALPEIQNVLDPSITLFLGGGGVEGDTIIAFVDDDGVSKKVECIRRSKDGPDEWVKTKF